MNYLDIREVENIMAHAMEESSRDHLMLLLSFRHGMRRGEVAALELDDIQDGQINIERLKGSLTTRQPLMSDEYELFDEQAALRRWLQFRPQGTNYLFPTQGGPITGRQIARIAKKYMEKAGVRQGLAHHHALKHAFCSIQARKGVKIEYIAQSVGHVDIKNTRIYLNITDSEAMDQAAKALSSALGGAQ
jgi:type 1 fimbriae regulatory protein FimB/type 1 fimbriae regulatory protein FimE